MIPKGLLVFSALLFVSLAAGAQPATESSSAHIVFLRDGKVWRMNAEGGDPRPVTSQTVGQFSVSRDGRLVYDRPDDLNVYFIPDIRRGGEARKLTSDDQSRRPLLSADGRQVVFQKAQGGGKVDPRGEGLGLWRIDLESGKSERLVAVAPVPAEIRKERDALFKDMSFGRMDEARWHYDEGMIWDGDHLLFSRNFTAGGIVSFWLDLSAPGSAPKALPSRIVTALDVSQGRVLRADNATEYRFWSYDIASGKETTLVDKIFVDSAAFSPDGKEIAFYRPWEEKEEGLWLIPSSGGKKTRLLSGVEISGKLQWSPDGKTLLFERYVNDSNEVWSVDRDGSRLRRLAQNASRPQWTTLPPEPPAPPK